MGGCASTFFVRPDRASNLAEIFRIRLEEMSTEKGSTCTLLSHVKVGVKEEIGGEGEGENSKDDEEDAAELEREVCSSRVDGCTQGLKGFDVSVLGGVFFYLFWDWIYSLC